MTTTDRRSAVLLRGAGISGFGMLFQQAVSMLSGLLIARFLGAAEYGLFSLARDIATLTSVFTKAGFDIGLLRRLGEGVEQEAAKEVGPVILTTSTTVLILSAIPLAFCVLGGAQYIEATIYKHDGFASLLTVMMLLVPCLSLLQVLAGVFRGRLKIGVAVFGESIMQSALRLVLSLSLVLAGYSIWGAVWGNIAAAAMVAWYFVVLANREFGVFSREGRWASSAWRDTARVGRYSVVLCLSIAIVALTKNLDVLVLGKYVSAREIGSYVVVQMIVLVPSMVGGAFGQLLGPLVASVWRSGRHADLKTLFRQNTRRISIIAAPIFAMLCWLGPDLVQLFGKGYVADSAVVVLLASSQMVVALLGNAGWALSMTGQHVKETLLVSLGLVVALALNIALVPRYGTLGAATATFVATVIANGVRVVAVYRSVKIMPIGGDAIPPILIALILAFVLDVIVNLAEVTLTPLVALAMCCVLGAAYVFVSYRLILEDGEQASIRSLIKRQLLRV